MFRRSVPPVHPIVFFLQVTQCGQQHQTQDSEEETEAVIEAIDELSAYDARS